MDWVHSLYQRECQKGLANYWRLAVSLSGQLEGSTQNVREFCDLLESLAPYHHIRLPLSLSQLFCEID